MTQRASSRRSRSWSRRPRFCSSTNLFSPPACGRGFSSKLPHPQPVDMMVRPLADDHVRALAAGEDILEQIELVDLVPDAPGDAARFLFRQDGEAMEEGGW